MNTVLQTHTLAAHNVTNTRPECTQCYKHTPWLHTMNTMLQTHILTAHKEHNATNTHPDRTQWTQCYRHILTPHVPLCTQRMQNTTYTHLDSAHKVTLIGLAITPLHQSPVEDRDGETAPSNLPWQGEKGPPPIRHTVTRRERATTNQTYRDKTRKGHHQSDIPWQDEKGPSPIRHTLTGWERVITNQTYHDKTRKGDHQSDI